MHTASFRRCNNVVDIQTTLYQRINSTYFIVTEMVSTEHHRSNHTMNVPNRQPKILMKVCPRITYISIYYYFPVRTQRHFNVGRMLYRRLKNKHRCVRTRLLNNYFSFFSTFTCYSTVERLGKTFWAPYRQPILTLTISEYSLLEKFIFNWLCNVTRCLGRFS